MPHDLELKSNGSYSFAYNLEEGLPWHGLGEGVQGVMTAEKAIEKAGLGWTVTKEPAERRGIVVPDTFWMVRDDDDKVLGRVGKDYKPIQNSEAFDFFDSLVESGEAKYETAGSLSGGKRIFLSAHIGDDIQVAGQDSHRLYLLLLSSHDGSKSLTALTTLVRVVCANTEQMALANAKTAWTMTHRQTLEKKVAEARLSLQLSHKYLESFNSEVEKMWGVKVSTDKFREMMTEVLPKQKRQLDKNLDKLTVIYESSPTIVDVGAGGTGWGAYNAVTEWLTHGREIRSREARFVNTMGGFGGKMRSETHKRIVAMA